MTLDKESRLKVVKVELSSGTRKYLGVPLRVHPGRYLGRNISDNRQTAETPEPGPQDGGGEDNINGCGPPRNPRILQGGRQRELACCTIYGLRPYDGLYS